MIIYHKWMKSCGDEMGRVKENQRERIKLCQKLLPDSLEIEIIIIMDSEWILPPLSLPSLSLTSTQASTTSQFN